MKGRFGTDFPLHQPAIWEPGTRPEDVDDIPR